MLTLLYVRLPYCCGGVWTDGQKITSTMPILQQWRGHTRVSFEKWARSVGGHIEPMPLALPQRGPPTSTATSCLRCFVVPDLRSLIPVLPVETSRQYDLREVRLTSGAQRGLASSRPEPHVLLGTNERGGQPWVSLARRSSSVSMFTRTPLPWPTRQRTAVRRWCRWG